MVRYCAAAAAATVLNRSRPHSRDRIGVEIICVSGFACGDGAGLVWRSTIEPNALMNLDVRRTGLTLVEAGARRSARAHTGSTPKAKYCHFASGPAASDAVLRYWTNKISPFGGALDLLVRPFRLFATNSLA
jgi:hypothetical protein